MYFSLASYTTMYVTRVYWGILQWCKNNVKMLSCINYCNAGWGCTSGGKLLGSKLIDFYACLRLVCGPMNTMICMNIVCMYVDMDIGETGVVVLKKYIISYRYTY